MNVYFREVQEPDNKALAVMIRQVFEEFGAPQTNTVYSDPTTDSLFELFRTEKSQLWVAESENTIVGCCGVYPTSGLPQSCAELVKFYLSPDARGKGVGRTLMEKSIESAIEFGYKSIYLESMPEFGNAVRIYEKLGFYQLTHPMGNSGHSSCSIWMLKEL